MNQQIRIEAWSKLGIKHGFIHKEIPLEELLSSSVKNIPKTDQIHSDKIVLIDDFDENVIQADAFVISQKGKVAFVRTADCVPLLFFDPKQKKAAAVHAGWKGTCLGIAANTVTFFQTHFSSKPENILVAIGPAICGTCYEVGDEVLRAVNQAFPDYKGSELKESHVDLVNVNIFALLQAGVSEKNISCTNICTLCSGKNFASFRGGDKIKRQYSYVLL